MDVFFTYKSMSERRSCLSVSLFIATLSGLEEFTAGSGLVREGGKRYKNDRRRRHRVSRTPGLHMSPECGGCEANTSKEDEWAAGCS